VTLRTSIGAVRQALVDLPRSAKRALAISLDALILFGAFQLALWLRFELFFTTPDYLLLSFAACASGIFALVVFGTYQYVLRYMTDRVALVIVGGVLVSIMTVTACSLFLQMSSGLSRGVLTIYGVVSLVLLLGVRLAAIKILFPRHRLGDVPRDSVVRVLIYGAGPAGSQLALALRNSSHYRPIALVDDDRDKTGLMAAGLRTYPTSDVGELVESHNIGQILIAKPTASREQINNMVEIGSQHSIRVRIVPNLHEMVDQAGGLKARDLQIEDLLGRDAVAPLPALLGRYVTGHVVMVSGAGGSIGSELCRQILALQPRRLVLLEISEPALYTIGQDLAGINAQNVEIVLLLGSTGDQRNCAEHMRKYGVETIYHAAAYKHVPLVEHNIREGIRTNAFGTLSFARAAIESGVKDFVLISTDKAVRPTNVMGATKRLAELVLQALADIQTGTRFSMVRFGNVLGSSGSVVPLFNRQIQNGGPVTLTHSDITRYFMTIPEAAQLVLQAGAMGASGSVFVLDMGEPVRIYDLAKRMIQLHGLTVRTPEFPDGDIEIRITGLRPGEKLYEELLIGGDVSPTQHPRIMQSKEHSIPYDELMKELESMEHSFTTGDEMAPKAMLKKLVIEYTPS